MADLVSLLDQVIRTIDPDYCDHNGQGDIMRVGGVIGDLVAYNSARDHGNDAFCIWHCETDHDTLHTVIVSQHFAAPYAFKLAYVDLTPDHPAYRIAANIADDADDADDAADVADVADVADDSGINSMYSFVRAVQGACDPDVIAIQASDLLDATCQILLALLATVHRGCDHYHYASNWDVH